MWSKIHRDWQIGYRKGSIIFGKKNPIYTFELLQKFDFQRSTTKSDNRGYPTIKTWQI